MTERVHPDGRKQLQLWRASHLPSPEQTASPESDVVPISNVIFETANVCQLDCDYCVVFHGQDQSWKKSSPFMSLEVVEQTAKKFGEHAREHGLKRASFTFHGAEATLAEVYRPGYFREAVSLCKESMPGVALDFGVQSNGITFLSHPEMLDEFRELGIKVGISLDGGRNENKHRVYRGRGGKETYDDVVESIKLIRKEYSDIFNNVLLVVDPTTDPDAVWQTMCDLRIPAVDLNLPFANHTAPPEGYDPEGDKRPFADWLLSIYRQWRRDVLLGKKVPEVRIFRQILNGLRGLPVNVDTYGLAPYRNLVIGADGQMKLSQALKSVSEGADDLGMNIRDHSFNDALRRPMMRTLQGGAATRGERCQSCPLLSVCGGGHLVQRYSDRDDPDKSLRKGFENHSVYCRDLGELIRGIRTVEQETHPWLTVMNRVISAVNDQGRNYPLFVGKALARYCQAEGLDPYHMVATIRDMPDTETLQEQLAALAIRSFSSFTRDHANESSAQEMKRLLYASGMWAGHMMHFTSKDFMPITHHLERPPTLIHNRQMLNHLEDVIHETHDRMHGVNHGGLRHRNLPNSPYFLGKAQ